MAEKTGAGNGCPLYKKCGACQLQNMSYPEQLGWKQAKTISLLGRFAHVEPIIGMDEPYHYRNKVQAAFGMDKRGIISGVYQSSSHRIVPVDSCMLEDETADAIIVTIRGLLRSFKLTVFDERAMRGFLRHVLIRRGFATNQIMAVLVTGTPIFPRKNDFIAELLRRHPEITTVVQNVNGAFTPLVLGRDNRVLYGPGKIEDVLCGYRFLISPSSFYQINPVQTEKLYTAAVSGLGLTGRETLIDAYCGIGTIGMAASSGAARVIGVESNGDAVRDAKENVRLNGIKNMEVYKGDAGAFMADMAESGASADAVIMDPPRSGSDERFMSSVAALAPRRVVYVSCNPETQARDLNWFTHHGYIVRRIQPVDMFPHTSHVETVVLMTK